MSIIRRLYYVGPVPDDDLERAHNLVENFMVEVTSVKGGDARPGYIEFAGLSDMEYTTKSQPDGSVEVQVRKPGKGSAFFVCLEMIDPYAGR